MYTLLRVTRVFCALCWLNENVKKASRDTLKQDSRGQRRERQQTITTNY